MDGCRQILSSCSIQLLARRCMRTPPCGLRELGREGTSGAVGAAAAILVDRRVCAVRNEGAEAKRGEAKWSEGTCVDGFVDWRRCR